MSRPRLRLLPSLGIVLAAGGCGPSSSTARTDLAVESTITDGPRPADFAAPPDLAFPGTLLHYVVSRVDLPASRGQYAIDDNGDGRADNQLAVLLGAMAALNGGAGFSFMQASQNLAVTVDGSALELVSLATLDAAARDDARAFATLYAANSQKFPDLGGSGAFVVDINAPGGRLDGVLAQGGFSSVEPTRSARDVRAPLRLGFWSSRQATLPLHGAHVEFTVAPSGLMSGQIHGVLTAADVTRVLATTLAADFTAIEGRANCAADADCRTVKKVLDLDGNGVVDADEIAQGPLGPSLRPDVEMFDANGGFAPGKANNNANAWSIGVGFTAVKARFSEP